MIKPLLILFLLLVTVAFKPATALAQGPYSQASNLTFYADKNSTIIGWTISDGTISRGVFITAATSGSPAPVNGTVYTPSTLFGAGAQIGTSGWYCVSYDSYANYLNRNGKATVTVTGLQVGVTYRVAVVECYGYSGGANYSTVVGANNPANVTPTVSPTVNSSNLNFTNTTANATTANWTPGNGSGQAVFITTAAAGNPAPVNGTTYAPGGQIGTSGWYCVSVNNSPNVNLTNLNPGTTYRVAVIDYRSYSDGIYYATATGNNNPANITIPAAPPVQASNLVFAGTTPTSTSVSWTNGDGTARAVFVANASTGEPAPANGTTYAPNTVFGSGTQIGTSGWYCVYDGTGTSAIITGLTAGQTYRVAVIEHATAANGEQYSTAIGANNPANVIAAYAAPSIQASDLGFYITYGYTGYFYLAQGNGASRAVFMAAASNGNPAPVNGTTYTANSAFGSGGQIGTSGWYCIYNGQVTNPIVSGLKPGTTYRIAAVEYNFGDSGPLYAPLPGTGNPINYTTLTIVPPTVAASNITFTNTTSSSTTVNWVGGNGTSRAVFVTTGTSGAPLPVNGTNYAANLTFGSGTQIGTSGWYCIYDGTNSSASLTGLTSGVNYRVAVVEYNGGTEGATYTATGGTNNPATITALARPDVQASNLIFSGTTANTTAVSWTNGNGNARAVFIANITTGVPLPADGTAYVANTAFGSGTQIGTTGWYCVYNGTGTSTPVTGLTAGQTYRIAVVEYIGSAGNQEYATASGTGNPANVTAVTAAPGTQAIITSVNAGPYQAGINIVAGNGSNQAVFISKSSGGNPAPVNRTAYTPGEYGSGSQIGTSGWYCVYNGTDTSSIVATGLTASTNYRVAVVAYNNTPGLNDQAYTTITGSGNNPVNFKTDTVYTPTVQASDIVVTNTNNTSATINFTSGNGSGESVYVALATVSGFPQPVYGKFYPSYDQSGNVNIGTHPQGLYGQPSSQIGTSGWYCVNNIGTAYIPDPITVYGLAPGTAYKVAVVTYNNFTRYGNSGNETYLTTAGTNNPVTFTTATVATNTPTIQASAITFSNIKPSAATIHWTNGNGNKRAVFISAINTGITLVNGTSYTANGGYGTGSTVNSSWYCVYNGTDSTANITGLGPGVIYQVAVVEYNENDDSRMYTSPAYSSFTSAPSRGPSQQASNIIFTGTTPFATNISWTNGNGTARVVFVSRGTDTPVPLNGTAYTAGSVFRSGSQIGTSGWYCVYNGTDNATTLTGLSPGITYRIAVIEYSQTGAANDQDYSTVTGANNPATLTTSGAPAVQASNVALTNIGSTAATVTWTNGSGNGRAVFITLNNGTYPPPLDGSFYTGNPVFPSLSTPNVKANWICVYNSINAGTGDYPLTITGLYPGATYQVAVVEFNSGSDNIKYIGGTSTGNPATFTTLPPSIITNGPVNFVQGDSVVLTCSYSDTSSTYEWRKNGVIIQSAYDKQSYTATASGSYTVGIPSLQATGSVDAAPVIINAEYTLPDTNFKVKVTSVTCRNESDGMIHIAAARQLSYAALVTGTGFNKSINFTDTTTVTGLAAGLYHVSITVAGQAAYEQDYDLNITEPQDLSVYAAVDKKNNTVTLQLNGGSTYRIQLNDKQYTTTGISITLPLNSGSNSLSVTTDKLCQGTFNQLIKNSGDFIPYPNPLNNVLNFNLGNDAVAVATVEIYNLNNGSLLLSQTYTNQSGVITLDVSQLKNGVYTCFLLLDNVKSIFKIIKQ